MLADEKLCFINNFFITSDVLTYEILLQTVSAKSPTKKTFLNFPGNWKFSEIKMSLTESIFSGTSLITKEQRVATLQTMNISLF